MSNIDRVMSELASNNPFRDISSNAGESSSSRSSRHITNSRNPFLDSQKNLMLDRPNQFNQDRTRRTDETGNSRPSSSRKVGEDGYQVRRDETEHKVTASRRSTKGSNHVGSSTSHSHQRPRSNSDTSAVGLMKERPDRARKHENHSKDKPATATKSRKNLDKIDRLDVTGFMTAGGFHHDGPFDACNPSRNKNAKKAPVLAFAKDSTAMTLAAGPPVQPVYFGDHLNNAESFADYGSASRATRPGVGIRAASFDPASTIDPIHGHESVGLGTTTFLEGAPASRSAMLARTVSDNGSRNEVRPRATSENASGNTLGRKKSVLQKIRGAYKDRAIESRPLSASPPRSPQRHINLNKSAVEILHVPQVPQAAQDLKISNNMSVQLDDDVASTSGPLEYTNSHSKLSPLYRPASNGLNHGTGASTSGLIKRVRSLRVGSKKRSE